MATLLSLQFSEDNKLLAATAHQQSNGIATFRYLSPAGTEIERNAYGDALPYTTGENFVEGRGRWQHEVLNIELDGDAALEYKARMAQGGSLSFQWTVVGGQVYYDTHAHDAAFGKEIFTRYIKGEGRTGSGTNVASYAGQHGWYWLNLEGEPITIRLEVSGFYEELLEIDLGNED